MPTHSEHPDFWNSRYLADRTPWDFGGVPAALKRYLAAHPGQGERVLIPGCGSGYEVVAFSQAGYEVYAIDFSPPAVARARHQVQAALAARIIEGDFFTHDFAPASFDFIYERTFLCALPVAWRARIVQRSGELLKARGSLLGIYFFGETTEGPPHGLSSADAAALFPPPFTLTVDLPLPDEESLAIFKGRERWQERSRGH